MRMRSHGNGSKNGDAPKTGDRLSNADARRELLATPFDRLIVKEGEISEYVPRADRAAEVVELVEQAIGPSCVINARQPAFGWRAKSRPRTQTSNGGKGGASTACPAGAVAPYAIPGPTVASSAGMSSYTAALCGA
jgi:hypothetical protein